MTEFNVDSLLDGTLDDLADMPEFKAWPAGTYRARLSLVDKTAPKNQVNKHPGFEIKLKMLECIELTNAEEAKPAENAETSILYLLDNEMGQGGFKKVLASAAEHFGAKSNRELIADLQNTEVLVITSSRQNKEKTQTYTGIVELKVL